VIELAPTDSRGYLSRAGVYNRKGNYGQAIVDYTKAIELNDSHLAEVYSYRATAYYSNNNYDKSWDDVHKAEELGYAVDSKFIAKLKEASGRDK
jgi:tetratricopeptide (TPR) repeat protein